MIAARLLIAVVLVAAQRPIQCFAAEPANEVVAPDDLKIAQVAGSASSLRPIGVAKINITPSQPVLLNGYAGRKHRLTLEVAQQLWARAVAIGSDRDRPVILIALDNLGIPADIHRTVAKALEEKHGIPRSRLTINASHTHSAPMLTGVANNIRTCDLTEREQAAMEHYTSELTQKLIQVAEAALSKRMPCRLDWGQTSVGFAINRRGAQIVDHSLPVLRAVDRQGKIRALITNYACHNVSAPGDLSIGGDWAGYAAERLETILPGSIALVLAGCGADQNPAKTGSLSAAKSQGHSLADAMVSLSGKGLTPVTGKLDTNFAEIELSLAKPFTKEEWQARAKEDGVLGIIGYHARTNLARLERGDALPQSIIYPVQTWTFGNDLAAVFLAGEVVVDYAKLVGEKHDGGRLWVSGYTNDAPCYIPSERVLREGGYEGGDAMVWYDKPRPFASGLEKKILDEVSRQLGGRFDRQADLQGTGGIRPLSPRESIARMQVPDDVRVELVAAEPLVVDPVAIDFGHDGKLWVAEMHDYPEGLDGKFSPGGRIKYLEDADGDGKYDKATTLLAGVPFPTGVKAWRKGVLICAAPDLLYAEDTNEDGRADITRKVLTGFETGNYQARVNSLSLGLDNWMYGAAGIFGGMIHTPEGEPIDANNRDFRFQPDTGVVEAVSGRTQQGRARDDWGNWFGCDSGSLGFHFPLTEHYYSRNASVVSPNPAAPIAASNRLFPLGKIVQWKLSGPPGVPTSACGLGLYRDNLLGEEFAGNAFICEPVNQLVHRMQLKPRGVSFIARRPATEQDHEFLASTDNWFRPVQVATGPDGALYVVDMYRYLIEHPRWLTPEAKSQVDARAGDTLGRIYRIVPKAVGLRSVPLLAQLKTADVAKALDSPNGQLRDMAHLELLWRGDVSATESLVELSRTAALPQVRLQALCALEGIATGSEQDVLAALGDSHPSVRRQAIRIAEKFLGRSPAVAEMLLGLAADADEQVRLQLAYSLGQLDDPRVGRALVQILRVAAGEPYTKSAALSSLTAGNLGVALAAFFENRAAATDAEPLGLELVTMAAQLGDEKSVTFVVDQLLDPEGGRFTVWQLQAMSRLLQASNRPNARFEGAQSKPWQAMLAAIRASIDDSATDEDRVLAGIALLPFSDEPTDLARLTALLTPQRPLAVQRAALKALAKVESPAATAGLFDSFSQLTPAAQTTLLDEALAQERLTWELLARIGAKTIPRSVIDPARRLTLVNHSRLDLRTRGQELFAGSSSAEIATLLQSFAAVNTDSGDPHRGREVFQKHCAACHRMEGLGYVVGPDLAALTDKSTKSMLTAIVDPNVAVDGRYVAYNAVTSTGQVFTGIMASESVGAIVLKAPEGKEQTILRKDLDPEVGLKNTGKSLMPEGLAREIDLPSMQNLLAFLVRGTMPAPSKIESVNRSADGTAPVGNAAGQPP